MDGEPEAASKIMGKTLQSDEKVNHLKTTKQARSWWDLMVCMPSGTWSIDDCSVGLQTRFPSEILCRSLVLLPQHVDVIRDIGQFCPGGFGLCGIPENLIEALQKQAPKFNLGVNSVKRSNGGSKMMDISSNSKNRCEVRSQNSAHWPKSCKAYCWTPQWLLVSYAVALTSADQGTRNLTVSDWDRWSVGSWSWTGRWLVSSDSSASFEPRQCPTMLESIILAWAFCSSRGRSSVWSPLMLVRTSSLRLGNVKELCADSSPCFICSFPGMQICGSPEGTFGEYKYKDNVALYKHVHQ